MATEQLTKQMWDKLSLSIHTTPSLASFTFEQGAAELALEHDSGVVAVAEHHEPFPTIGSFETVHVQTAQPIVRRLV